MENSVLMQDFSEMVKLCDYGEFSNKKFLITGATGLIGSLMVKYLLYLNQSKDLGITVYAFVRNLEKAKKIFKEWKSEDLHFFKTNLLENIEDFNINVDYIVHAAGITSSKVMISQPVETLMTAINGTKQMLDLTVKCRASMIFISSMEVYGNIGNDGQTEESMLGYIDLSNVRSCYPEGKRVCECLCKAYADQYHAKVVSARLAQTFGAGILPDENRVFAQFARSAIHGESIVLHTLGKSEGNYVYTSDAIRAILMLLTKGTAGEAYNISNMMSHMTIAEMAELVVDEIGNEKCSVIFELPDNGMNYGYAADTKLFLNTDKINQLGWHARIGLRESYRRLAAYLAENEQNRPIDSL